MFCRFAGKNCFGNIDSKLSPKGLNEGAADVELDVFACEGTA